jgi:hypothetical protein
MVMSRSKGDGRRVFQDKTGAFTNPTDAEWKKLEDIIQRTLPLVMRRQIAAVSVVFSVCGSGAEKSDLLREVVRDLDLWRRRTNAISRRIWCREERNRPSKVTREWIEETYFDVRKIRQIGPQYHLWFVAHAMDAAVAASEWAMQELTAPSYKGPRHGEMWLTWAAVLIHIMDSHGISTTASSATGKQHKDSPFVKFIKELQQYVPEECRRYKTSNSIVNGIKHARKLGQEPGFEVFLPLTIAAALRGVRVIETPSGLTVKRTKKYRMVHRVLQDHFSLKLPVALPWT